MITILILKIILKNQFSNNTSLKIKDKYINNNFCFGFTLNNNDNYSLLVCIIYRENQVIKLVPRKLKINLIILLYF